MFELEEFLKAIFVDVKLASKCGFVYRDQSFEARVTTVLTQACKILKMLCNKRSADHN